MDEAENQIDWFERKNKDTKKSIGYAKINLDDALHYKERFSHHMTEKRSRAQEEAQPKKYSSQKSPLKPRNGIAKAIHSHQVSNNRL